MRPWISIRGMRNSSEHHRVLTSHGGIEEVVVRLHQHVTVAASMKNSIHLYYVYIQKLENKKQNH